MPQVFIVTNLLGVFREVLEGFRMTNASKQIVKPPLRLTQVIALVLPVRSEWVVSRTSLAKRQAVSRIHDEICFSELIQFKQMLGSTHRCSIYIIRKDSVRPAE